jgi:hypothetical protein
MPVPQMQIRMSEMASVAVGSMYQTLRAPSYARDTITRRDMANKARAKPALVTLHVSCSYFMFHVL